MFLAIVFVATSLTGCRKKPAVLVMAHRGASADAPENTQSALVKAVEAGADYSEIDVHQTKDGVIVLLHDKTLQRTTGQAGNIWDFTWEELKRLDAGLWFGKTFEGEPIPTLEEIIRYADGRIKLNIEVKISGFEPGIVRKVVDTIHRESFVDDCLVTSFDREAVERVKELDPKIRTGLIFGRDYPGDVFTGNWETLSCHFEVVDESFMQRARNHGKTVFVWTVDEKEEMLRLIRLGVDAIITNKPDLLMKVLSEQGKR